MIRRLSGVILTFRLDILIVELMLIDLVQLLLLLLLRSATRFFLTGIAKGGP